MLSEWVSWSLNWRCRGLAGSPSHIREAYAGCHRSYLPKPFAIADWVIMIIESSSATSIGSTQHTTDSSCDEVKKTTKNAMQPTDWTERAKYSATSGTTIFSHIHIQQNMHFKLQWHLNVCARCVFVFLHISLFCSWRNASACWFSSVEQNLPMLSWWLLSLCVYGLQQCNNQANEWLDRLVCLFYFYQIRFYLWPAHMASGQCLSMSVHTAIGNKWKFTRRKLPIVDRGQFNCKCVLNCAMISPRVVRVDFSLIEWSTFDRSILFVFSELVNWCCGAKRIGNYYLHDQHFNSQLTQIIFFFLFIHLCSVIDQTKVEICPSKNAPITLENVVWCTYGTCSIVVVLYSFF